MKTREGAIAAGANASINLELANLKRIYTLAMQAGKVLQRPHVPMLKEDNVRTGFFERAQFEGVRARLKPPLAQAVTLAYYTGWRVPSEVLTLEWHQVDRKACVIRLEPGTTKNRDGRRFTYGELTEVREATRQAPGARDRDGDNWRSSRNRPIDSCPEVAGGESVSW